MKFYLYDKTYYRRQDVGDLFERLIAGEWQLATGPTLALSEEEYNRMREISPAEADKLPS